MRMNDWHLTTKHRIVIFAIICASIGAFALFSSVGGGRAALTGESPFAQECRKLLTREDFMAMCPNGAAMEKYRVVTLADSTFSAGSERPIDTSTAP